MSSFYHLKIKRFYYMIKWLITGDAPFKNRIKLYSPEDISSLEIGQTIRWVNRAECSFGVDDE